MHFLIIYLACTLSPLLPFAAVLKRNGKESPLLATVFVMCCWPITLPYFGIKAITLDS
jgi:hypothetical protein